MKKLKKLINPLLAPPHVRQKQWRKSSRYRRSLAQADLRADLEPRQMRRWIRLRRLGDGHDPFKGAGLLESYRFCRQVYSILDQDLLGGRWYKKGTLPKGTGYKTIRFVRP